MRFGVGIHNPPGLYAFAPGDNDLVRPQLTTIEEDACSFASIMAALTFASQLQKEFGYGTHVYISSEE